jgi:hypothetical protein
MPTVTTGSTSLHSRPAGVARTGEAAEAQPRGVTGSSFNSTRAATSQTGLSARGVEARDSAAPPRRRLSDRLAQTAR